MVLAIRCYVDSPSGTASFAGEPVALGPSAGPVASVVAVRATEAPMRRLEHVQIQVVAQMEVRGGIKFEIVFGNFDIILDHFSFAFLSSTLPTRTMLIGC